MKFCALLVFCLAASSVRCQEAQVSFLVGKASVHRAHRIFPVRVSFRLEGGDTVFVSAKSRLEIRYPDRTLLRLDENSRMVIRSTAKKPEPYLLHGRAWANVTKVSRGGNGFNLRSPTAVAAVRGTIFRMNEDDSTVSVRLYNGRVDVGPSRSGEVTGPDEISLDQWVHLWHGQEVVCTHDGKWTSHSFSLKDDAKEPWVRFNTVRDSVLGRSR